MKKTFKLLALSLIIFSFASCLRKDRDEPIEEFRLSTAISIFTNNDKVGLVVYSNENYVMKNEFWIDGVEKTEQELQAMMPDGSSYHSFIDNNSFEKIVFRNNQSELIDYKFVRFYNLDYESPLYYYKDDTLQEIDTVAYGAVYSVDATDEELFAGFFGMKIFTGYQMQLYPNKAFYLLNDKITILQLPKEVDTFAGISAVHKSGEDVYVAGIMGFPMYWKNGEVVKLSSQYGVVNKMATFGEDVYAVGYAREKSEGENKNSAYYWINKESHLLENNAVANSIFIDENGNIFIAGAKIKPNGDYQACYWKNGERVDIEK